VALLVAVILGLLNAVVRPILVILTLPVTLLTLGLFIFVINALLFQFVASFVKGFDVAGFWPAFWGSIVYSLISWAVSALVFGDERPGSVP
jgi:putative membrane protein